MVPKSSLQLVALCCIQVAAKYEETEELVPSLSKLRYFGSNIYSVDIIRKNGIGRVRGVEMVHGRRATESLHRGYLGLNQNAGRW